MSISLSDSVRIPPVCLYMCFAYACVCGECARVVLAEKKETERERAIEYTHRHGLKKKFKFWKDDMCI